MTYVDENTPHVSCRSIEEVVVSLENVSEAIFQWFRGNVITGKMSCFIKYLQASACKYRYCTNKKLASIKVTWCYNRFKIDL